ncbi:hypothetical protein M422DRAFT_243194, partial [Sphaerobolus stellatus SS14]
MSLEEDIPILDDEEIQDMPVASAFCLEQPDCASGEDDSSFWCPSPSSVLSYSSDSESEVDISEIANEAELLNFGNRLQTGLQDFLKASKEQARPSRYNRMGRPAKRTQRRHDADLERNTKILWAQGYRDISGFFQKQSGGQAAEPEADSEIEFVGYGERFGCFEEEEETSEEEGSNLQK